MWTEAHCDKKSTKGPKNLQYNLRWNHKRARFLLINILVLTDICIHLIVCGYKYMCHKWLLGAVVVCVFRLLML